MFIIFKNPKINFVKLRFIAYAISSILVISGLVGIFQIITGKANMGIDLSGGSVVSVKFEREIPAETLRAMLTKNNMSDASLQQIAEGPGEPSLKALIKIKSSVAPIGKLSDFMKDIINKSLPNEKFVIDRVEDVGPVVSGKLRQQAFWAIVFAFLGILIYIWFRFDFKFGVAAIVATAHDVLVLIGIIYLTNKEFSLLMVTALLTIAGYSLTDTVVVFDRIRENLKKNVKETLPQIINISVNEILNRTIMTSVTTIIVVVVFYIWGGEVVHDFSFALTVGIVVGTYSSWFVASPILLEWETILTRKRVAKIR